MIRREPPSSGAEQRRLFLRGAVLPDAHPRVRRVKTEEGAHDKTPAPTLNSAPRYPHLLPAPQTYRNPLRVLSLPSALHLIDTVIAPCTTRPHQLPQRHAWFAQQRHACLVHISKTYYMQACLVRTISKDVPGSHDLSETCQTRTAHPI